MISTRVNTTTLNHQLRDRIEAAGYDVIVSFTKSSQDAQSHVKRLILAGQSRWADSGGVSSMNHLPLPPNRYAPC